jgi:signal transduction histidine kinase
MRASPIGRHRVTESDAREASFMGKITRNITHEMTNVLAAIGENSALIEDVLSLAGDVSAPTQERISRAFRIIEAQVERGVELATRLNTLAHSTDQADTEMDLNEVVEQIAFLSRRLARLKGIDLKIVGRDQPVLLNGNPLRMQIALFDCIELLLENLQSRSTVVLRPSERNETEVRVDFAPEKPAGVADVGIRGLLSSPQWDRLQESVKCADGRIEVKEASGELRLVLGHGKR